MGNLDLVVIFNDNYTIKIKGTEYSTDDEALDLAINKYRETAKSEIELWYKTEKEQPEMVVKDYDIQGDWRIQSIKIYTCSE